MLILDNSEVCAMCGSIWEIRVENYRDGLPHCEQCIALTEDLHAAASLQTQQHDADKRDVSARTLARTQADKTPAWRRHIASLLTGVLGERGVRALTLRRLRSYAHHISHFAQLEPLADSELVSVRGRATVVSSTVQGALCGQPALCCSVDIAMGDFAICHQSAVDFYLEDPHGQRILIRTADAQLSCPNIALSTVHSRDLREILAEFVPHAIDRLVDDDIHVRAGQYVLRPGDDVTILGYKTRIVDHRMSERLARDEPYRMALESGPETPVLIASATGK